MRRAVSVAGLQLAALIAPPAAILAIGGSVAAGAVAVMLWIAYALYCFYAGAIWPEVGTARARAPVLGGTVLTIVAFVVGFFANWWISVNHSLCGSSGWGWVATLAGLLVYVVAGGVLLRAASRLLWLWPLLVLVAWFVAVAIRAALPGGHGFCET